MVWLGVGMKMRNLKPQKRLAREGRKRGKSPKEQKVLEGSQLLVLWHVLTPSDKHIITLPKV